MMNELPGLSRRGQMESPSSSAAGGGASGSLAPAAAAAGSSVELDPVMRSMQTFDGGSTGYGNYPSTRTVDSETHGDGIDAMSLTGATHGGVAPTTVPAGDTIVHIVTGSGRRDHGLGDGTPETRATTTTGGRALPTGTGFHDFRSCFTDAIRPVFASTTSVFPQDITPPVSSCTRHAAAHPTHPSAAAAPT